MKKIILIISGLLKFTFFNLQKNNRLNMLLTFGMWFVMVFFTNPETLIAQNKNNNPDKLNILTVIPKDTLVCYEMLTLSDSIISSKQISDYHKYVIRVALGNIIEFATNNNNQTLQAKTNLITARYYQEIKIGDLSAKYYELALNSPYLNIDTVYLGKAYCQLGKIYHVLRREKESLRNFNKALQLFTSVNDKSDMAIAYLGLSAYSEAAKDYKKADTYTALAEDIFLKAGMFKEYAKILRARSARYKSENNTIKAKECLIMASNALEKLELREGLEMLLYNDLDLAVVYSSLGNEDTAKYYLEKTKRRIDSTNMESVYSNLFYKSLGFYHNSFARLNEAINCYKQSVSYYTNKNNLNVSEIYNTIAEIYIKQKKLDSALFYKDKANKILDNVYSSELKQNLVSAEESIRLMRQDFMNQKRILESEKERDRLNRINLVLILFAGLLALTILLIIFFYRNRNLKVYKENLLSQVDFLKAQLNPHFLFNSINNIYVLIDVNPSKAASILMKFSELLRYQLYECDDTFIPLVKEIEFLKNFIELEKLRYEDKIRIDFKHSIPHNVNYKIAPLLLQPFIENAFKHTSKSKQSQSFIKINISLKRNKLDFRIENNYSINEKANLPGGIGLDNVKKRLDLLYSGSYFWDIKNYQDTYVVYLTLDLTND